MDFSLFDAYNLRARFSVVIFYILPFLADAVLLNAVFDIFPAVVYMFALVALCQAAMGLVRDIGKKKGENGNSAADLLAPGSSLPVLTKRRYYRKLAAMEPEFAPFATLLDNPSQISEEEVSNLCWAAIRWLRGKTRDSKTFSLLKEENINYGFRRNLYALRIPGLIFNFAALLVLLHREGFITHPTLSVITIPQVFLHLAMLLYFWFAVTKESVETASKRYAETLLEAIDLL